MMGEIGGRGMGYLFENMEKMDIQAERRNTQREKKRADEAEKENLRLQQEILHLQEELARLQKKRVTWVIYTVVCLSAFDLLYHLEKRETNHI